MSTKFLDYDTNLGDSKSLGIWVLEGYLLIIFGSLVWLVYCFESL